MSIPEAFAVHHGVRSPISVGRKNTPFAPAGTLRAMASKAAKSFFFAGSSSAISVSSAQLNAAAPDCTVPQTL